MPQRREALDFYERDIVEMAQHSVEQRLYEYHKAQENPHVSETLSLPKITVNIPGKVDLNELRQNPRLVAKVNNQLSSMGLVQSSDSIDSE